VKETTLQTLRSVKKERGGGARDAGAESLLLKLMLRTVVRHVAPPQSMEVHGGADFHL